MYKHFVKFSLFFLIVASMNINAMKNQDLSSQEEIIMELSKAAGSAADEFLRKYEIEIPPKTDQILNTEQEERLRNTVVITEDVLVPIEKKVYQGILDDTIATSVTQKRMHAILSGLCWMDRFLPESRTDLQNLKHRCAVILHLINSDKE